MATEVQAFSRPNYNPREQAGYPPLTVDDEPQQASSHGALLPHHNQPNVYSKQQFGATHTRVCDCIDWKEVKLQCWLAGPMILVNIFQMAIQLISVMFVGHLGELALSGSSIATSFANVTGFSLLLGMGTTLETLCGQSYGAKQYHMLGLYLQRGMIVLNATAIPLAFIFASMGNILVALGQDQDISRKAGEYALWLIPALFAYASSQPLIRFLQTQSLVFPMLICSFATICCHIPLCWLMVYRTGLENRGAALATSISNWINVALLLIYVRFSRNCQKTRTRLSWEALHDLKIFLKLAVPSAAMVCLEWWCYESLVLLSGLLPNPQLQTSTLSICINTAAMAFMVPFGFGAAISTRVSNELGAGRPQAARDAVHISMALTLSESLIVSATLLSIRKLLGRAYSNDEEVIEYVATLMPLLAISTILDSLQAVLSGVVRGCGRQVFGAVINLGSYYIVGLPIGCILAFIFTLDGKGLWVAVICAPFVQTIALGTITWMTNWSKEAHGAAARVDSSLSSREPLLLH